MRLENAVASDVLERILSAYGFTMQKELSDRLEIAKSNVASWLARGQVPGNVIVQCSLDTGADVKWLVTGELEKSSSLIAEANVSGKAFYDEVMANGGKPVLRRILDAYGFTLQKQLCELLGISSGTVSTWVRRNYFPGDVVVTCALDTGVDLLWLATGKGSPQRLCESKKNNSFIDRKRLVDGMLIEEGYWEIDLDFVSHKFVQPCFLNTAFGTYIVDMGIKSASNGCWLLDIDGKHDVYKVTLLPGLRMSVSKGEATFECAVKEINLHGKALLTIEYTP